MKQLLIIAMIAPLICAPFSAAAAEHTVKEMNSSDDGAMVFEPEFIKIKPGDTVHIVASDKGHNVQSIVGMAPEGVEPVKGGMSKDLTIVLAKPGLYGYECLPHFGMGMVLLVQVGPAPPPNLAEARAAADRTPPMAKKRLAAAFAKVN